MTDCKRCGVPTTRRTHKGVHYDECPNCRITVWHGCVPEGKA